MGKTISQYVDIEVSLEDFDDDDLIEELENRGLDLNSKYIDGDSMQELIEAIYNKRRQGHDYQKELDNLIYYGLGRLI